MKIGTRYIRTSPSGDVVEIWIKNQGEREYHQELEKEGFKYVEKYLPTGGICTACEG